MDDKTKAQLKERFASLPAPIQDAITSVDIQKKMREAADTHKLHLDQWETLENEVLMTLFGLKPVEQLQENIQKEVGVSQETAAALTADISHIVFEPIRQELERQLEHPEAKEKEMSGVEQARQQALGNRQQADQAIGGAAAVETSSPPAPPVTPPPAAGSAISYQLSAISPNKNAPDNRQLTPDTYPKPATPLPAEALAKAGPLPVMPATPPPSAPTERAVRAPTSSVYKSGESSAVRKEVHEDPYREPPA